MRVPRIVTHTRRINYARRLVNSAHRRTVRRNVFWTVQNSKSRTNRLRRTSTYNHRRSTFGPPTNYAYDARSAQKRKYVRNSFVIHAFSLCDWPLKERVFLFSESKMPLLKPFVVIPYFSGFFYKKSQITTLIVTDTLSLCMSYDINDTQLKSNILIQGVAVSLWSNLIVFTVRFWLDNASVLVSETKPCLDHWLNVYTM